MPIINRFADWHDDIAQWRQTIHAQPELQYDVHKTAAFVCERLNEFGVDEVISGIGQTGVVGLIHGKLDSAGDEATKVVGLRADMDALPIQEVRELPYKSTVEGKMHACGHDGHTAMLLGAARYLAETRQFKGTVAVIFQPAEEGGGGGKAMVDDGMMERFGIQQVFGMHNMPGLDVGKFAITPGPMMAAADTFHIEITGRGGHAARPHGCIDPAMVTVQLVQAIQTIVSRNAAPLDSLVISVTQIHLGDTDNVIPQTAMLGGTVRTFSPEMRVLAEKRIKELATHISAAFDASIEVTYELGYPVTVNHVAETETAGNVAAGIVSEEHCDRSATPMMGAEDFSYMLESRPGAFIFIGQGDSAGLHHPEYDFNDEIIPIGCSYWVNLAETTLNQ